MFTVAFLTSRLPKAVGLPGCFSALPSTRVCSGHEKRQWVQDDSQGNGPGNKHGISIKEEAFYSTKQLSRSRVKTAEAPPAPPGGWQRRDLLSNRWGERGGGGQSSAPFPVPSSSQRFGMLERISLPSALDLPRLPEKTPPPSAKDKSTTERWSFGGGERGGSGEEKADGNSLLINGNEWVRGEIRRDREWGVCSAASLERQAFTHCTRCTGQSYRSR